MNIIYLLFVFVVFFAFGKKNKSQLLSVECMQQSKGVSALLIAIGHTFSGCSLVSVGMICVAIFFFWSGYGLMYGYKHKPNYLHCFFLRKLIEILIPLIIAHLINFIVKSICGVKFVWKDFIASFLGFDNIVKYTWYITVLLVFYLFFWLVFLTRASDRIKVIILSVSVVLFSVVLFVCLGIEKSWWVASNLAFLFGIYYSFFDLHSKNSSFIIALALAFFLISFSILNVRSFNGFSENIICILLTNIEVSTVAVILIILSNRFGRINKVGIFLGKISFEFYLMHSLFIFVFSKTVIVNYKLLYLICIIFSTIIVSYILNKADKKLVLNIKKLLRL